MGGDNAIVLMFYMTYARSRPADIVPYAESNGGGQLELPVITQ